MDRDELAKKIRENIFERCGEEGHASKEVIERAIIDSLGKHLVKDSIRDVYTLAEAPPACPTVQQIKAKQPVMPMPFKDVSQGVEALIEQVRSVTWQPWPGMHRGMGISGNHDALRKYWSRG